jgi:hypothetical protein
MQSSSWMTANDPKYKNLDNNRFYFDSFSSNTSNFWSSGGYRKRKVVENDLDEE